MKDTVWEEDTGLILLALPVHEGRDNSLAWHFDKHGRFSVKSAYKVRRADVLRNRRSGGSQGSNGAETDHSWKQDIWKLRRPRKVKHFLWRFAHSSHPLRCNLVQRGMKIDAGCPVCGNRNEDGGHLFFKCRLAKDVWRLKSGKLSS